MPARTRPKGVSYYPSLGNLRVPPSGMEDVVEDGKRANVAAYRTDQPKEQQFEKQVDPISARATGTPEQGPTVRNRATRNSQIEDALAEAESNAEDLQAERETAKEEVAKMVEEGGKPAPEEAPAETTSEETEEGKKEEPTPTREEELQAMTVEDLRARAAELQIEGRSALNKDSLVSAILAAEQK